jgi:uncharacterized membrane protein
MHWRDSIAGSHQRRPQAVISKEASPVLTRRDLIRAVGGVVGTAALSQVRAASAAPAPQPMAVLVNESFLRQNYPDDVSALLEAIKKFAQRENGQVVSVGREATPQHIKAQLVALLHRPKRLVIFGEEKAIPRFRASWGNGKVYFLRGAQYLRYDLAEDRFEEGYPKQLDAQSWPNWPRSWTSRVRAGVNWDNGKAYFFKGDEYLRYDMWGDRVDEGYPKPISGNWPGFPETWFSDVDAAVNWGNGKVYLFKGAEYLRYDIGEDKVDKGYPRPLNAQNWPNWPASWKSQVDAAAHWGGGTVYFFRGPEYLRYDMTADRVLDGYPRPIAGNWPGFSSSWASVDSVYACRSGVEIDSFYGDLDGDGLVEAAVCRVLGSPQAMLRQLEAASGQSSVPHVLSITADPREGIETSRIMAAIGELGGTMEFHSHPDAQAIARADYINFGGHGNPHGWYKDDRTVISDATVPDLPRRPIVWAGACSTTTPGAPILRAFMEKGCRVYVGAASDAYGWTTAYLANELNLHFVDALRAHPDGTIAELVGEARNRFVRVNGLASVLVQVEKGQVPAAHFTAMQTALQWQVFGDITAAFPRSAPRPIFARQSLAPTRRMLKSGDALQVRFDISPADGLSNVFLRCAWDRDVSQKLRIDIMQNDEVLHRLDWREQREYWAYADVSVGGYWEGDRYQAVALAPLIRRAGANTLTVRVVGATKPIELLTESGLEVWPKRAAGVAPQQATRQSGPNLLWLCHNKDLGPMQKTLASIDGLQFERFDTFGDMLAPYEFPENPDQLLDLGRYDIILLDELPNGYRSFPRGMGARLRAFVRQGGGLIMAGGPWSFSGKAGYAGGGQGGYGGTPVEEVLPVRIAGDDDFVANATTIGRINAGHPVATGLNWSSFPAIVGHNRVSAEPGANVLARTATGDPLIIIWTHAKGKAAAITSPLAGEFGSEFSKWPDYPRFWANLIRWVIAAG